MIYKKAEDDNAILKIMYDYDPEDPREWDNIGKMVCWHNRYNLGDKHNFEDTRDMFECEVSKCYTQDDLWEINKEKSFETLDTPTQYIADDVYKYPFDYLTDEELWDLFLEKHIILPLYLYDHSGITMNTSGFSCGWDSGQVGWIYANKDSFRKETGYTENELFSKDKHRTPTVGENVKISTRDDFGQVKKIENTKITINFDYNKALNFRKTENTIVVEMEDIIEILSNCAEGILKGEVELYDLYLTGRVYSFMLEEKIICNCCGHTKTNIIEDCYGFYGGVEELKEEIKHYISKEYHHLVDKLKDVV